jgi:hypothetical protein
VRDDVVQLAARALHAMRDRRLGFAWQHGFIQRDEALWVP